MHIGYQNENLGRVCNKTLSAIKTSLAIRRSSFAGSGRKSGAKGIYEIFYFFLWISQCVRVWRSDASATAATARRLALMVASQLALVVEGSAGSVVLARFSRPSCKVRAVGQRVQPQHLL